ncbi:MAG TPA: ATP-binding protein [Vicinamibacterales bacterium]|jgi:signal transduction histidine kinase/ActR/RegA family two-component response regulator
MAVWPSANPFGRFRSFNRRSTDRAVLDRELLWTTLPWTAQIYVALVIIGGAWMTVALFPQSYPQPELFIVLLATTCLTSLWKVNLPIPNTSGSTLSVSYAANLTALLLLGPPHALIVAMAGVWTQCTYKPKRAYPLYRTVFSTAAEAITMAATGWAYQQLGGPLPPHDTATLARPLVGAIATYFVFNTGLVASAIALTSDRTVLRVWREDFLWSGASYMVAGTAGALAAVVVTRGEHWKAVLLIAPVYLTYRTYELFVGRLDDQSRHMAEVRRLHQEALNALRQAKQAEHAEQAARGAAERANRLKDEFLAIVSHELRTPLNAILGWSDMLRRGRVEDQRRDRVFQAIHDGARRQAQLIDDLLDVSRIISGKLRLERTAVDLRTIVEDAVQAMQLAAEAKQLRMHADLADGVGLIDGDGARLQQVVSNLLSNAIKFTPEGGSVHVVVKRTARWVELTVSDTGQGIRAEFLPEVFEPFRQADGSTTRVHGGLGLGLSIAKHLVEAHHGSIRADSAGPGNGATFTVRLPAIPQRVDLSTAAGAADVSAIEEASIDGVTVLVVDDDYESRQMVAECLESRGAAVHLAGSASAAYAILQRERIDVLLADIAMPEEDGYAMIRRIRAGLVPDGATLPSAALTAFARADDRLLALRAGFQMHLAKPVDPDVIVTAVAKLASGHRSEVGP